MRQLCLLAMLALGACAQPIVEPPDYPGVDRSIERDVEFDLARGESVTLRGSRLAVHFAGVTEESRCPMNARCVWEGNAKVAIEVTENKLRDDGLTDVWSDTLELNTSDRFATRTQFRSYDIALVHLEPTPMAGQAVEAYVVTLRVGVLP